MVLNCPAARQRCCPAAQDFLDKILLRSIRTAEKRGVKTLAAAPGNSARTLPHEVIRQGAYDVRLYKPRFAVEMRYESRQDAYKAFDHYLTGHNADGLNMEAPPPIVMRHDLEAGEKVMQMFVVPFASKLDAAALLLQPPFPEDERLAVNIAGGEAIAAISFPGQATKAVASEMCNKLKLLLQQDGVQLAAAESAGVYRLAQYDPVYSLKERKNEVWLAVQL